MCAKQRQDSLNQRDEQSKHQGEMAEFGDHGRGALLV